MVDGEKWRLKEMSDNMGRIENKIELSVYANSIKEHIQFNPALKLGRIYLWNNIWVHRCSTISVITHQTERVVLLFSII